MPAQTNARLTKISGGGSPDDWDVPGTAGGAKWTGDAPAYYTEKRERLWRDGATDEVLRRFLIVDTPIAKPIDNDDTIEFTYDGVAQPPAKVQLIERRDLPGLPAEVRTTRLTLNPA